MSYQIPLLLDVKKLREFELTPAEIRVAMALFQGKSVCEYAKSAGIAIGTARWHVRQVYEKSNVHRQSELIYRLLKREGESYGKA